MSTERLVQLRNYGLAVACTAVALGMRMALEQTGLVTSVSFLLFDFAIVLSAWVGGLGPGLTATVLSMLLIDLFFFGEKMRIDLWNDTGPLALFFAQGVILSWLGQTRKYALDRAERSLERFELLVEGVRDYAILMLDTEGRVISWNAGAQRMKGYSADEILGKSFVCFYTLEDIRDGQPQRTLGKAAREGRFEGEGWRVRKDGSRFWANVVVTPVCDKEGELRGFAKITQDASERRRAEETLREAHHELEARVKERTRELAEANSSLHTEVEERRRAEGELRVAKEAAEAAGHAKDRFLAVLSHELRTPLTPVLAVAGRMLRRSDLPTEVLEAFMAIRRNVELQSTLVDDLLDLTRIAKGKIELNVKVVDIRSLLRRTVEICEEGIAAKGLQLALDFEQGPRWLRGDPSRLQQVFWNLLKNAIKFTPEGGRVAIRCGAGCGAGSRVPGCDCKESERVPDCAGLRNGPPSRSIVIEVSDTGRGIDPAQLGRIFEAFEQGDPAITRQFGGLGLGLSICKAIVEMHGGVIVAQSEGCGKGSLFRVELPTCGVPLSPCVAVQPARGEGSVSPGAESGRKRCVLLVEDHVDTAQVMRDVLLEEGYDVQMADSVTSAMDVARGRTFDVLVSDMGLPDGNGLELMRSLSQTNRPIKGIIFSGYGMDEDVRRSREAGYMEHLTKPVDPEVLLRAVARACND